MEQNRQAPIGVFDSGVGGLTVAREIMRNLPSERIVYFGDTARVPYGNKSKNIVLKFSRQIVHFLQTQEVKAIVVACNTASALALETIREEIDIPIIGVVKPGAKVAAEATRNGKIGVIATEGTINSQIYSTYIKQINENIHVIGKACPLFVPLVEEGLLVDPDRLVEAFKPFDRVSGKRGKGGAVQLPGSRRKQRPVHEGRFAGSGYAAYRSKASYRE